MKLHTRAIVALALLGSGCIATRPLRLELEATERLVEKSKKYNAAACAPVIFANAQADASFARIEFEQGDVFRARTHIEAASAAAKEAWALTESCGAQDYDGDGIADVVDQCPEQPEDFDGDRDTDGCRDLDPYGDVDKDGVRNIDDVCPDEPEDFDGHNDEDGCPETSGDTDGDGVIDATDACPEEAEDLDGFKDSDGCPDPDNDLDGVPDLRDQCVNAAEDLDDWEDSDGCPDNDNDGDGVADLEDNCPNHPGPRSNQGCATADKDGDGIADGLDKCPSEKEVVNGYKDDDGCPDDAPAGVKVSSRRIELPKPILFVGRTAEFDTTSYAVLDSVVSTLQSMPTRRVRIEGHTDASADEAADNALSRRRAESVFDYLTAKGIDPAQLDVTGFGGARPIDTNRTASGREANQRIELWFTN